MQPNKNEDLNLEENPQQANQEPKEAAEQTQDISKELEAPSNQPRLRQKSKFWKSWTTKKKTLVTLGSLLGVIIFFFLVNFIAIRPSKTSSYVRNSWHDLVINSSDLDRAVSSEVNLAGTRSLADGLYNYNQRLGSVSFEAKGKNSLWYNSGITKEYGDLTDTMREYFSSAATTLAKSNDSITEITESELNSLKDSGESAKKKVDEFRTKRNLQEDLNPNLFALDTYIREVKDAYEKIEKEKKQEEEEKAKEATEKAAKEAKDQTNVRSVSESYFTAFINGNEEGVRATLSKGFQTEYDYGSLRAERRTDFYPKSYRIVSVDKDGQNYKVTASVTYVSKYTDSSGNPAETVQPTSMIYRVVYASDTSNWKIDGQLDR